KEADPLRVAVVAAAHLRAEDERRLREIRDIVIASVNNAPVRVDDVVEGGRLLSSGAPVAAQGVVVNHQTRLGKFGVSRPRRDAQGRAVLDKNGHAIWDEEEDKVQGVILMRKYEETLPALAGVKAKVK